jgi:hypothetical protein
MQFIRENHKNADEHNLGKITSAKFGLCGYQGAMIGLSVTLENKKHGWIVGQEINGFWSYNQVEHTEYAKWSEQDRAKANVDMVKTICQILDDAKVDTVDQLVDVPVEVAINGINDVVSWRVLTEVI